MDKMEQHVNNDGQLNNGVPPMPGVNPQFQQPQIRPLHRDPKKDFSVCGLALLAFLGASVVGQSVVLIILMLAHISPGDHMLVMSLASYAAGIPACYFVFRLIPVEPVRVTEKWSVQKLLVYFIIAVGMTYIGNIISQIVLSITQRITGIVMENPLDDLLMDSSFLFQLGIVVIVGPIVEELVFRKFLIDRIRAYGQGIAVLISGIAFGLFHGNLHQAIYAFFLGCIFAYIYVKTDKIRYCMIFHIAINFMGSMVPLVLLEGLDMDALSSGDMDLMMRMGPKLLLLVVYGLLVLTCMITTIVLIACFYRKITFAQGSIRILKGYRFKTIVLNVGGILFLVGCAFLFLMTALGSV